MSRLLDMVEGMHRSRIGVVLLDFPDESHEPAQQFWSDAVGREAVPQPGDPLYASLGVIGTLKLEVQRTGPGTPPRVHLDVETDDVSAEVERLMGLGATIESQPEHFTVLRDPSGMLFCVVPVQTGQHFDANATTWP